MTAFGLRDLDLNLLPVFEAIYVERSLTRASDVLHITQPAVSNALARLRTHLGDPLFVRSGRGVVPTPRAESLIVVVREALSRLRSGLAPAARFAPETETRVFHVAVRDTGAFLLAPALATRIAQSAPGVRIQFRQVERTALGKELASGRLDLAIDIPSLRGAGLDHAPLLSEPHVCVLRRGHPATRRKLDLARFLSLRHITVSSRPTGRSLVEEAVRGAGGVLQVAMRMPHYLPAFAVVMASDFAMTAPRALARAHDVTTKALPVAVPPLDLHLYWRSEVTDDPGLRWLRAQLRQAVSSAPQK